MFMQCGFGFLEAGSTREKNVTNILIKNVLDLSKSIITFSQNRLEFCLFRDVYKVERDDRNT